MRPLQSTENHQHQRALSPQPPRHPLPSCEIDPSVFIPEPAVGPALARRKRKAPGRCERASRRGAGGGEVGKQEGRYSTGYLPCLRTSHRDVVVNIYAGIQVFQGDLLVSFVVSNMVRTTQKRKAAMTSAGTTSAKPAKKKQSTTISSKQEQAESRNRRNKDEIEALTRVEDESEEQEGEQKNLVRRSSTRMGGMHGLMLRGRADGSSSSDSGADEDENDENSVSDSADATARARNGGGSKKRLLSAASSAGRASNVSKPMTGKKDPDVQSDFSNTSSHPVVGAASSSTVKYDGSYKNRQRVLVFCSRGVTARYRHLLEDLRKLIPHHKKDVKLDCKGDLQVINEIAEVKSCNNCLYLEARKRQDLYLWLSKTPLGPSIKFSVLNVHTLDELRLTGNAMLGSRPVLSFDEAFDARPHTRVMRALLVDAFGTPRGHPKSKPFVDRVLAFALADGKVWVRNYQIVDAAPAATAADPEAAAKAEAKAAARAAAGRKKEGGKGEAGEGELTSLVEIGPRFVLNPIRVFAGSFGGPTLYQNPDFTSPNFVRAEKKRAEGARLSAKMKADGLRKERKAQAVLPKDELQELFRVKV